MQSTSSTKQENSLFNVYVFGNALVKQDSLPSRLLPLLQKTFPQIHFLQIDPTENLPEEKHLIIMDTIINAQDVCVLKNKDLNRIQLPPQYSLHDFDLGFNLRLMKKLGKVENITLIGVPPNLQIEKALRKIQHIIASLLSRNASRN